MAHGDAFEGDILAAFAIQCRRQSVLRVLVVIEAGRPGHIVIDFESDAAEDDVPQIGSDDQRAAGLPDRVNLGDDNRIAIGVLAALREVIECPGRRGAIQKPKAGLPRSLGRAECIPCILDDVTVMGYGPEGMEGIAAVDIEGSPREVNDVPGGVDQPTLIMSMLQELKMVSSMSPCG